MNIPPEIKKAIEAKYPLKGIEGWDIGMKAFREAAEYGYSLSIEASKAASINSGGVHEKLIEGYKRLCRIAGVPDLLIEHPNVLFGKPTDADIEWAKKVIEKHESQLPQPSSIEVEKDLVASDNNNKATPVATLGSTTPTQIEQIKEFLAYICHSYKLRGIYTDTQLFYSFTTKSRELLDLLNSSTTDERTASQQLSNQGTESLTQNSSTELLEALSVWITSQKEIAASRAVGASGIYFDGKVSGFNDVLLKLEELIKPNK